MKSTPLVRQINETKRDFQLYVILIATATKKEYVQELLQISNVYAILVSQEINVKFLYM